MTLTLVLFLAALFVAFANGANDNFKGVATLHGTGRLSYGRALALATVSTAAGSLCAIPLSTALLKRFSGKGLVADAVIADPSFLLAVALGSAGTVLLATRLGFPISTTHALTGGLLGAGIVLAGSARVSYGALGSSFVLPLVLSPFLSLVLAAALYTVLRWTRRRLGVTEEICVCVGTVRELATAGPEAGAFRLAAGPVLSVGHRESCELRYGGAFLGLSARTLLDATHALSAGAVGFARGLNDTPKIAGLLVGASAAGLPAGVGLVAVAMAAGGLLAARRVARTLSFGITGMNDGEGASANLVTAALVTLASPLGLPVSTTHVSCGALFGIGTVNGLARRSTIAQILAAWLTTLPLAAALAAAAALGSRAFL